MPEPRQVTSPIPLQVSRIALNEALRPFYALLGITENHVYEVPGIHIAGGAVTFVVPAVKSPDSWMGPHKRPAPVIAPVDPQSRVGSFTAAELQTVIRVEVLP